MRKILIRGIGTLLALLCVLTLTACNDGEHTHTFSSAWAADETHHWHESTCGHPAETDAKAEHVWGDDSVCDVCARTDTTPKHEHEYDDNNTCVTCGEWNAPLNFRHNTTDNVYIVTGIRKDSAGKSETPIPRTLVIPSVHYGISVTAIDDDAFKGDNFASVVIPDSIVSIGDGAFANGYLTSFELPSTVTEVGAGILSGCEFLTELTVETDNPNYDAVTNCMIRTSDGTLVQGCKTSVLPTDGSIQKIGDRAFYAIPDIQELHIPEGVTHIGDQAFLGMDLTELSLPASVKKIGEEFTEKADIITVDEENTAFKWTNGCLIDKASQTLLMASRRGATIPSDGTVKHIGEGAFSYHEATSISIPSGVTTIGTRAFAYAKTTAFSLPISITTIETEAFCFAPVVEIAIAYSGSMTSWNGITKQTGWYDTDYDCVITCTDGKLYANGEYADTLAFTYDAEKGGYVVVGIGDLTGEKNINIPATFLNVPVVAIGESAFSGYGIVSVTIPSSVKTIEEGAFESCRKLSQVTLPASLKTIGADAFNSCVELTSITLPNSIETIGAAAFRNTGLETVVLPVNLAEIPSMLFGDCDNLTTVTFTSNVKKIGDAIFYRCPNKITIRYIGTETDWRQTDLDYGWDGNDNWTMQYVTN